MFREMLTLAVNTSCLVYHYEIIVSTEEIEEVIDDDQNRYSPLVPCHFL